MERLERMLIETLSLVSKSYYRRLKLASCVQQLMADVFARGQQAIS